MHLSFKKHQGVTQLWATRLALFTITTTQAVIN